MTRQCIKCRNQNIEEVVKDNKRYFFCRSCDRLYDRAIDNRKGRDVVITSPSGLTHVVAGGIVWFKQRFLLVKRRTFPFGYAFPAGHVEYGETPDEAFHRELFEETGLSSDNATLVYHNEMKGDRCRYGAENHIWYFFAMHVKEGTAYLNAEGEKYGWFTTEESLSLNLNASTSYLINLLLPDGENMQLYKSPIITH